MAYPSYPCRVTCTHWKCMIKIVGEDSIVHGWEVGLFELITVLETPDVQKGIVRRRLSEGDCQGPCEWQNQVMLELIPLRRIRQQMNKLQWEQEKMDKEWTEINEWRNVLREGQERLELHDFGASPVETIEWIKMEPIDDWVIHQTPQPRTASRRFRGRSTYSMRLQPLSPGL